MTVDQAFLVLQINPTTDKTVIKKAFRRLAHIYHPDKGGDEKKMKDVNMAYNILYKNKLQQNNPFQSPVRQRYSHHVVFYYGFYSGFTYGAYQDIGSTASS